MVLESQTVKGCAAKYQALHLIGGWMIKENSRQFIHFNLCLWLLSTRCREATPIRGTELPANPFQVSEYLLDHRRVFNAGDEAHITTAIAEITSLLEGLFVAGCR
jgi:hypothetical protein